MSPEPTRLRVRGIRADTSSIAMELIAYSAGTGLDMSSCEQILRSFVALGSAGGFSASTSTECRFELSNLEREHSRLKCEIAVENVDLRCLQYLRSMAWALANEGIPIKALLASDVRRAEEAWIDLSLPSEANEEDMQLRRRLRAEFEVNEDELAIGPLRRCVVQQQSLVERAQLRLLQDLIEPWFQHIDCAAFSLPDFFPTEAHSVRGSVMQFEDDSYEICINRYRGSDVVWDVLVNLLTRYHFDVCRIVRIAIE